MEQIRELIFYKHHFEQFFEGLTVKVKDKIDYVLFIGTHAERIPEKFLKHIEEQKELYESEWKSEATFTESSAALIKANWLFFLMAFKRKRKGHQKRKLNLH